MRPRGLQQLRQVVDAARVSRPRRRPTEQIIGQTRQRIAGVKWRTGKRRPDQLPQTRLRLGPVQIRAPSVPSMRVRPLSTSAVAARPDACSPIRVANVAAPLVSRPAAPCEAGSAASGGCTSSPVGNLCQCSRDPLRGRRQPGRIDLHPAIAFSIVLRRGPDRRGSPVGDPSPLEVPQQPGRELPSVDQGRGTGDETLRLAWAGPTVAVCVRQHPTALWAPSSSDQRARMANRDDQPLRGLEPDHYRRSGLKDAVSHHLLPAGPLTSTAPQAFPNNLTMPLPPRARSKVFIAQPMQIFDPRAAHMRAA